MKQLAFTAYEREVMAGCLIGDGSLQKAGKQYRLRIEHAACHKQYVEWKYAQLQRFCINQPQYCRAHDSYRFGTVGHSEITRMRYAWYAFDKQIVKNFRLTPLMAAIWFMDDGTKHRKTVNFSVHNFSAESIKVLCQQLQSYNVETTVNSDSKGSRLYVRQKSYSAFETLIKPYILECMAYKLP